MFFNGKTNTFYYINQVDKLDTIFPPNNFYLDNDLGSWFFGWIYLFSAE